MGENWKEEARSAYLYRILAQKEKNTSAGKLFENLAAEAEKQARIWNKDFDRYDPDLRAVFIGVLIKLLGPRPLLAVLAANKIRGISIYSHSLSSHPMPKARSEIGRRHHSPESAGNLRAAIFGMNDGIVSNTCLILGVAGASVDSQNLFIAGVAGLTAGALSMAAGEYVSVRSQRELYEYQIGLEKEELERYPEEEAAELSLIYEAKGMEKEDAQKLANRLIQNPDIALDTLAREELGLDPSELGSPWGAALFSFICFSVGAFIPLIPNLFETRIAWTFVFSLSALFMTGAASSLFTGRSPWWSGFRMLLIGSAAGGITFYIGQFVGEII